jgi:hypothetical protein
MFVVKKVWTQINHLLLRKWNSNKLKTLKIQITNSCWKSFQISETSPFELWSADWNIKQISSNVFRIERVKEQFQKFHSWIWLRGFNVQNLNKKMKVKKKIQGACLDLSSNTFSWFPEVTVGSDQESLVSILCRYHWEKTSINNYWQHNNKKIELFFWTASEIEVLPNSHCHLKNVHIMMRLTLCNNFIHWKK